MPFFSANEHIGKDKPAGMKMSTVATIAQCNPPPLAAWAEDAYYLALRQTQATIRTESPDWQPLKQHFRALVERRTLKPHGGGSGVWYDLR
jgi:hypothetical protein